MFFWFWYENKKAWYLKYQSFLPIINIELSFKDVAINRKSDVSLILHLVLAGIDILNMISPYQIQIYNVDLAVPELKSVSI